MVRNVACVQNQNKINDLEETLQLTVALDSKKVSVVVQGSVSLSLE